MDSLARQEAPTEKGEYSTPRIESKLQLRKKELNKIIWSKRTPNQSILGYNLSLRRRKRYRRKKKCWVCGSVDHLKAECPVHRESRLRQRVAELEERIQNLEDFINIQNINRKKRDKRKREKMEKKKKKKHKKLLKVLNASVKIKSLILEEEATWAGTHAFNAGKYLEKMGVKTKEEVSKAYKKLFDSDLITDMANAICAGDDYFESLEDNPPT